MDMSKVVRFHELGGPEVLKIEEWEAPAPQKGEVLLDVAAFALNRADILFFQGLHYTLPTLPSRLGSEASGTVVAVGEGVDRFAVSTKELQKLSENGKSRQRSRSAGYRHQRSRRLRKLLTSIKCQFLDLLC